MTDEKDENGNLLPDEQRLTKFGRFLRSTSLDELPELVNIIIGDMAIVGPRPLLIEYIELSFVYNIKYSVFGSKFTFSYLVITEEKLSFYLNPFVKEEIEEALNLFYSASKLLNNDFSKIKYKDTQNIIEVLKQTRDQWKNVKKAKQVEEILKI